MAVSVVDPHDVQCAKAAFAGCLPDAITCHPYTLDGDRKLGRYFVRFFWVPHRRAVEQQTTLLETSWHPGRDFWIARIQVHPSVRRRGYGRVLARAAEQFARSLNCRRVRLYPSHEARPFWRRLGYDKDPSTTRAMVKQLNKTTSEPT